MLCYEGKLSLYCFTSTSSVIFLVAVLFEFFVKIFNGIIYIAVLLLCYALINLLVYFSQNKINYQISWRSSFLGFIFAISILCIIYAPIKWKSFGIYGTFMAIFHYSEFLGIAWSSPKTLSISTFLLYHSPQYVIAAISSWLEFILEVYFFPDLKMHYTLWVMGSILCLVGEILRKLAMVTIKTNFTHVVRHSKADDHCLITHGIYGIMRHPSYVGWFCWSVGTQIVLANPLCVLAYIIASWMFFNERIYIEEMTLLDFFGKEYYDYQQRVPILLPFIKGYKLPAGLVEFLK